MNNYTLTFNENVKGWTSFHSFNPEWMIGMNNNFFSFYKGELYIHNSDEVPRNQFYGVQYPSKVSVMFNDSPSEIKEIKAVSLEGSHSWNSLITAYISSTEDFTQSNLNEVEFVKKEGIWYAYARRNENIQQLDSKSAYGIGKVSNINENTISLIGHSDLLTVGDKIVKSDLSIIGQIIRINKLNSNSTIIEMTSVEGLNVDDFIIGMKNARIEGGNLRGYTIKMDLDIMNNNKVELFAVNSEVMKSNP